MNLDDLSAVSCQGCGVYDASLRCSSHPVVVSVIVTANQSARTGIWCARCRNIESAKAAAITVLAGWWSLRGPALTIAALKANLKGGDQNVVTNAQMLRGLAGLEFANRNFEFASMFARAAHAVQPQRENSRLIDELSRKGHRNALPDSMWRYVPFAPVAIFAVAVCLFGLRIIKNNGVASAADIPAPTHTEASAVVRRTPLPVINHAFENEDLTGSADELEKRLTVGSSRSLVRAYVRARLSEARAVIPTRVRNGEDLMAVEGSLTGLGQNPALASYLSEVPVRGTYDQVVAAMGEATRYYHGGAPVDAIERTAGESLDVSVDMTLEALDNEMRGHGERADSLASDADKRLEAVAQMKSELRLRSAIISTTMKAIDACLYAAR